MTTQSSVDRRAAALAPIAEQALVELAAIRPSQDGVGAAIAAAGLRARQVAKEIDERDRTIRIARREGATLRALAKATGLSHQTIANICKS
jgi:hypothetical protein